MNVWDYFAQQFGISNILPIALAGEGVESDLPEGVRGKVPSVFNSFGKQVGFKDWHTGRVKASDVERWKKDKRYGFGVRLGFPLPAGGVAVCIDVDTEDEAHQHTVENLIANACGALAVPMRVRDNSVRRAYVVCVETQDVITKRVFVLRKPVKAEGIKGEAVEILAHGQQFAAYGRHPTGADIEWLDAPAESLSANVLYPDMGQGGQRLSLEAFNALLDAIGNCLPVITDTTKRASRRNGKTGQAVPPDDVALYLDANGWTLSIGPDGERRIRSPFESEYTNEQADNDTSVTYFLPGTNDYEQGHFVSLHASDSTRTNADFLDGVGFVAAQFVAYPANTSKPTATRPTFTQIKGGKYHDRIEATLLNTLAALSAPDWLGYHIAFDEFAGDLVMGGPGRWRAFRDTDYTALRVALELKGFMPVGRDLIRDAVHMTAEAKSIDTAREWLTSLKWDKKRRIDRLLPDYFQTADDEYTRAVSAYLMTAIAGRILQPGIQADMMPILIGDQGCGKSRGVQALAPCLEWFTDSVTFRDKEDDQARKLRGVCVAEFAEMSGLRKRDVEDIKAMVTRTTEKWVRKYQENASRYQRRAIFVGTSNDSELLDDATGARRWLPVEITGQVDVQQLRHDAEQLYAEAAARFVAGGIAYADATKHVNAQQVHEQYRVTDGAELILDEWLHTADDLDGSTPASRGTVTTNDAITALKGRGVRIEIDRAGQMRAGKALKALGFDRRRKLINNRLQWVYSKA